MRRFLRDNGLTLFFLLILVTVWLVQRRRLDTGPDSDLTVI